MESVAETLFEAATHRLLVVVVALCSLGAFVMPAEALEPSPGCSADQGLAPELLAVNGLARHAIVALPDGYDHTVPHALVFAFHGRTSNNAKARRYFGLEGSSRRPTIHAYPAGLIDDSGRFTWWRSGDAPTALRDLAFFDALLEELARAFCIDLDRVFVVGHSLGATFANSLGCTRGELIRGVASVAGGINPAPCSDHVAAMLLHNPEDRAVPISEGRQALETLLGRSVETPLQQKQIGPFACEQFGENPTPVLWCPHSQNTTRRGRHYPHQWPAGAEDAIASFFSELSG